MIYNTEFQLKRQKEIVRISSTVYNKNPQILIFVPAIHIHCTYLSIYSQYVRLSKAILFVAVIYSAIAFKQDCP